MIKIAVGQFCGSTSIGHNLESCLKLIKAAAGNGCKMIFLPEASDFIAATAAGGGDGGEAATLRRKESLSNRRSESTLFMSAIKDEAKRLGLWLSLGWHEQSETTGLPYNAHSIINTSGDVVETYRKIHLFDVDIENGPRLRESKSTERGSTIVKPVDTPVGKIGMATCYDLRFPELSVILRRQGAEILTFPSAFTSTTGTHHWFPLLQARAIENQCFVVAAAQIGIHNPSISQRESFGGSCIIDPWGQVLAKCSTVGRKDKKALQDEEQTVGQVLKIQENQDDGSTGQCELAIATLDHLKLFNVRREMPVFEHRRNDVYTLDLK